MKKVYTTRILNNLTLSQKMILIFIGSVIIPLAIQNAFYYRHTEENIQSQMMQRLTGSLDEKANKVNGIISGIITLSNRYNTNEELYEFLDNYYSDDIGFFVEYQEQIKENLLYDLAYNQNARRISLYTDNHTVLNGSIINKIPSGDMAALGEELIDYHIYKLTDRENGPKLRISLVPAVTKSYDRFLSIIRPLDHYQQYNRFGKLVRIDINISCITSILEESVLFDNIVLVDSHDRIIASANTYREFGRYDIFSEDNLKPGVVVLKQPLGDVPLSVYGYYNSKIISDEFQKMRGKTIVIVLGSMTFSLICIMLVAGNITKRTNLVVNQSKQIAKGNFIQIYRNNGGKDEIEVLADSMNQMSMKLKTLIEEEYNSRIIRAQLEQETTQAKLLALQSQVNPHFMFNALESIRLKAVAKEETETAKMILYMSRMFRRLIKWNDDITRLYKEIEFLREYLNIQKYRFDDEFEYVINVDEAALECMLPKFLIQPLVENACIHGIETISAKRVVAIHALLKGERLEIRVCDNGNGICEEKLATLRELLKNGKNPGVGVGLANIYQRLNLYYGREFNIGVKSNKGKGTEFAITIPIRHSREEFCVLNSAG